MKVKYFADAAIPRDEIHISSYENTEVIRSVCTYIDSLTNNIVGKADGKEFIINVEDIFYCESVDKQTYVYLEKEVIKCDLRLFEIEDKYRGTSLIRISKSLIVNMMKVKSIVPQINRNLTMVLMNEEQIICSRRYASMVRSVLKMKGEGNE